MATAEGEDTSLDGAFGSFWPDLCIPKGQSRYRALLTQLRLSFRHSELQQQRQGHKSPVTWWNSSDLQVLLTALNVTFQGGRSEKRALDHGLVRASRDRHQR